MTMLDDILARALLVHDRAVPRDTVAPRETASTGQSPTDRYRTGHSPFAPGPFGAGPGTPGHAQSGRPPASSASAAEDLRALCETLIRHTPATAVSAFVTDQVPEPHSALVLACVLQLTDTDDAARFWWQYAAGAGQPGAAYCLYLHHLALGETHAARWWHTQTDEDGPPAPRVRTTIRWDDDPVVLCHEDKASTATIVRVLSNLAQQANRPRSAVVSELMEYMPTAVAIGYLREPDSELPLPGPAFARKIQTVLDAASDRPDSPDDRPAQRRDTHHPALVSRETAKATTR
ncbi:hypothetical protein ACGFMM_24320 [Streptomyces sp. NPDC048604]|uniref:hypothetical protein n=1 Tax=Streptomyces sp. NPDC048604 TaxID=3365578 RepID=UPI0037131385